MKNQNKNASIFGWVIIIIFIVLALKTCNNEEDHDDGMCDICGKTATYSSSDEEYCDEHLGDAVEWYLEQGEDN